MKFYLYDTVRTKTNLKEGEIFGNLAYTSDMKAEGAISCVDATDKTYRIFGSQYWYSEDMLEPFQCRKEPLTNADRIRGMTDEELAQIIDCQNSNSEDECIKTPCRECILKWLKQEARNNVNGVEPNRRVYMR